MSSDGTFSPSNTISHLGASLHCQGEISGGEDLRVDGSFEGPIRLEGQNLTVGASAKLTSDIVAREVVVYGSIKGNLRASDRIEIKRDGSVIGDITTARILIEDGAYFKGSIEIDRKAGGVDTDTKVATSTPRQWQRGPPDSQGVEGLGAVPSKAQTVAIAP
jgi:cytoskeletal protein CcmA (bactofilin family)